MSSQWLWGKILVQMRAPILITRPSIDEEIILMLTNQSDLAVFADNTNSCRESWFQINLLTNDVDINTFHSRVVESAPILSEPKEYVCDDRLGKDSNVSVVVWC
jgi:hypothetical protein